MVQFGKWKRPAEAGPFLMARNGDSAGAYSAGTVLAISTAVTALPLLAVTP